MSSGDSSTEREAQLRRCIADVMRLLDELGTEWTVAGAFAAAEYRDRYRYTTDGDFLVLWHPDLPDALEGVGFETRVSRDGEDVHLIRARRSDGSIDLIIAGTDYQRLAIERGAHAVLTIEDVLVHKVIAWRPKDQDDIRSILEAGHEFDREYVERWTVEWGFVDRWHEALGWT